MDSYETSGSLKDQSVVEYQTLSSSCSLKIIENPERLHEWLNSEEIDNLHKIFLEKQKLSFSELREELEALNIDFTDNEYNRLFLKINQNRDFKCDWNEFVSYLIFGFQEDDPSRLKESLILPISSAPIVRKSEHRSVVCSISLIKNVSDLITEDDDDDIPEIYKKKDLENEETDEHAAEEKNAIKNLTFNDTPENKGIWLTASKEGQIRFWTSQFEPFRSAMSESLHLKMSTCILCIQALSDVGILCTSSTERELRFHETIAPAFILRIVIRSMPFAVCRMAYSFHPKCKTKSRLILGDYGGNVRILEFSSFLRGPFQSKPGAALIEVFWSDILKGKLPLFKTQEYLNIHSELIQQVFFSLRLNALFVAAEYRNTKKYRGRCPGLIMANGNDKTIFRIPLGVTTFCVDEKNNIVVTGGPDTFVRIWDVYVSSEPSGILTGHNGGIVMVFIQPEEKKLFSVDYQKIIKVWDLTEHVLLQTYGDLVRVIPAERDLTYYYHVFLRVLLVGGRKLVAIKCNPRVRVDLTDGNTHAAPVSVVLYNRLFRNVVTCGLDSFIIVWDPWTGRRKIIIKNCHTQQLYGEHIDIEITAACFDPLEQFLLTGARDGSLKIWNYNNAVCIRNMSIRPEHAVTAVIWVVERILAVGWDQRVTEFNDAEGREYGDPKKWPTFHTDDITCADVKLGEGVVTATYSGELIFWKLETGQPYRRYSVSNPKEFIELKYNTASISDETEIEESQSTNKINISRFVRRSVSETIREINKRMSMLQIADRINDKRNINIYEHSRRSKLSLGEVLPMSVQAVLFLQSRPMTREHGSVFVALETGIIQVYSHHQRGGYLNNFNAIHKTGDCILTMTTDRKNRYLFTGSAFGYVKIWHIQNYCIPEKDKVKVCMPMLRLQFIFLRNDRFIARAKRAVRRQPEPMLVSSYKGHIKAINSIVFINLPKILITGSHDRSCRLWSLGGRYLGTLGTPLPWKRLSPFEPVEELNTHYRMPPDIKKVASSTTMKVITGEQNESLKLVLKDTSQEDIGIQSVDEEETLHLYGKSLREPILGKHFQLPGRTPVQQHINVDITASYIPVFTHLKIHEASNLERPSTPPTIRRLARENYMEFYKSTTVESERTKEDILEDENLVKSEGKSVRKNSIAFISNEKLND